MSEHNPNIFTKDLCDRSFRTDEGISFTILETEHFPKQSIATQHRKYLSDLRPGLLVSVSFYGQPVPLITVDGGVVRLVKVECGGETLGESLVISKALQVTKTRQPMGLSPV